MGHFAPLTEFIAYLCGMNTHDGEQTAPHTVGKKDYRQRIRPERKALIFLQIMESITAAQATRDPKYSAAKLATALQTNNRYIAAAISHCLGCPYSHMMAALRMRDLVRLMHDEVNDDLSIEELGLFCGFSSRQSLYQHFTLFFPMLPAAYRRHVQKVRTGEAPAIDDPAAFIDVAVMAAAHFLRLRGERPEPADMPYLRALMGRNLNIPPRWRTQVEAHARVIATGGCTTLLTVEQQPAKRRTCHKS